jgi:hypothetical protein
VHKSLDAAVVAGDAATAESVARTITARLEAGRQQIAYAAGWQPASDGPARPSVPRLTAFIASWIVAFAVALMIGVWSGA